MKVVETSTTTLFELGQSRASLFDRRKRFYQRLVQELVREFKNGVVVFQIAIREIMLLVRDFRVTFGNIGSHVRQISKFGRIQPFHANTSFVESLDRKHIATLSFQRLVDQAHVIERSSVVQKIDLTVGL